MNHRSISLPFDPVLLIRLKAASCWPSAQGGCWKQKGFRTTGLAQWARLTLSWKEEWHWGGTAIASTFLAHFIPAPKSKSGLQFLVYLKVLGTQISKWGIRNVQSLFEDFLEFGALWFLLFRKGFGCLFIIQCRLMNNFLGDWPTFLVPLASLAQQGSFRASSQHPVWEWPSFLRLLSSESLLKWPPAQEGPLWRLARENSPGF